jgi:hypothetical protein
MSWREKNMKKIVIGIICLIAFFAVVRAYSQAQPRFTFQPSVLEYADKNTDISFGFGFIDASGDATKSWNIFPIRISLRSGSSRFYLAMNGISLLTQSGIYFETPQVIRGLHRGDVVSFGGDVTVYGRVEGNVWTFGSNIYLKSGSVVTGDVVALGGRINQEYQAYVQGNKNAVPQIVIPFLGLINSARSAATLHFIVELAGAILYLLILFLVLFFNLNGLKNHMDGILTYWKGGLLFLALSIIVIPVLGFFLAASVVGVLVIPLIVIAILCISYYGFLAITLRLGKIFLSRSGDTITGLFLCGLIGLLCIKGPMLLGILAGLLQNDILNMIGAFLKIASTLAVFAAFLFGFGSSLVLIRKNA